MGVDGVIIQASYRIFSGRPVVHLFGRLTNGDTFLLRDHNQRPHFYIAAADVERAQRFTRTEAIDHWRNFDGQPVAKVTVGVPSDAPILRDKLQAAGIPTFEADVRFAYRYLIDRGIKGSLHIDGPAQPGDGVAWVFDDPVVAPCAATVPPRVLSFDIETDPTRDALLAISLFASATGAGQVDLAEVLLVDPLGRPAPPGCRSFADEAGCLAAFMQAVHDYDPDILTGWNCIDFDLRFLQDVAKRTHLRLDLGRLPGDLRLRPAQGYFGSGSATVVGRLVLDGLDLVRGAFVKMDEYSLDAVSRAVLGTGKVIKGDVKDRVGEILDMYRDDLPALATYALADARLVLEILDKLDLVRLAFARSRLTGMMPDRVAASIASFDFLYLTELAQRRLVAPTVGSSDSRVHEAQAGGQVFEPLVGLHQNVWVFDFMSLYPSIIRTFNIDPVGFDPNPATSSITLGTAKFSTEPGILPALLDDLFPARARAKADGDAVASQAIKILMNSMYGVLGTPACRFYNPAIANAITGQGRHLLRWMRDWFEQAGYRVLYGDTDSLFVAAGNRAQAPTTLSPEALGEDLAKAANDALQNYVAERWQVPSKLQLEFEKLYTQLFLPAVRGGSTGARKRYAGLKSGGELEFVGLEVVRRDWTDLAKQVQRELYARLFGGDAVDQYLQGIVGELRRGALDDQLVYRKGLRRAVESYANTPPHVVAARKSTLPLGRIVSYVISQAGPEPLDNRTADIDREHYVQKQVRPVAEPVLEALGLRFDQVVGDDKQLGLF